MSRKRYAPLINVASGILALGETIGEAIAGDVEASVDSGLATVVHLLSGLPPYICKNSSINYHNALLNLMNNSTYLIALCERPSKSISLKAFPFLSLYTVAADGAEAYKKKKIKEAPI